MYPSSKNKASFRIADILHQQQQQQQNQQQTDSQLLAHHLMMKNNVRSSEMNQNTSANQKLHSKGTKNESLTTSNLDSPSPDASPIPEKSPEHGTTKVDVPMKPTPMYTNFPMAFPLGIHPAFHPAAYLNYADAIHKGETEEPTECRGWFRGNISNINNIWRINCQHEFILTHVTN